SIRSASRWTTTSSWLRSSNMPVGRPKGSRAVTGDEGGRRVRDEPAEERNDRAGAADSRRARLAVRRRRDGRVDARHRLAADAVWPGGRVAAEPAHRGEHHARIAV